MFNANHLNRNNFRIDLFHGTFQLLLLQVRVMAVKDYSTLPKTTEIESHRRMQFIFIPREPHFSVYVEGSYPFAEETIGLF